MGSQNKVTIRAKIIRILDSQNIVVNIGKNNGVSTGDFVRILGKPESVIDPDTDEVLGEVTVYKTKLKIYQVFEKFSLATSKFSYQNIGELNILGMKTFIEEHNEKLLVRDDQIQPWKARSEEPICIGDEVEVEINVPKENE